jgi:hypothetical protein
MIWPILKSIDDGSAEDLSSVIMLEGEDFEIHLTLGIGPADSEGAELFQLTVISPSSVAKLAELGPRFLRHHLVSNRFDISLVRDHVERLCRRCTGETWNAAATKLARYLYWEFEDYVETPTPR